ncbi:hypothetical protein BH09ACT12_BH09ACT12_09380 [soil metagenome]
MGSVRRREAEMKLRELSGGRRDDGAAAVEFALVVIPLMTLMLGILGYGFMLSFRQSVSQAAAEGARAAAVAPPTADREAVAFAAIAAAMDKECNAAGTYLTCTAEVPTTCSTCFEVTVSYAYTADPTKPVFLGLGLVMPDELTYTATAQIS